MTGIIGQGFGRSSGIKAAVAAGGGFDSIQVFTSSGTWNRPSGITKIIVEIKGGGGGGGGAYTDAANLSGTGGAEGGTAIEFLDVSSTASATVTVGAGGAGGGGSNNAGSGMTVGANGGTTSFGSFCTATGGVGGSKAANGTDLTVALGGLGANGDLNLRGACSIPKQTFAPNAAGLSGSGAGQGGGNGVIVTGATGVAGVNGGGGGGGQYGGGGQAGAGGAGGAGYVLVKEYK